jgi:hypothetical protein
MATGAKYRRRIFSGAMTVAAASVMVAPAIATSAPLDPTPVGGNTTTTPAPPAPKKAPPAPEAPETPGVQTCNETTNSGGHGVTETRHVLGTTGPASFVLEYETYDLVDEIAVFYDGWQIANTGFVGDEVNEGTGSIRVIVPPGASDSVLVRVTGPEDGTVWDYTVKCPDLVLPLG